MMRCIFLYFSIWKENLQILKPRAHFAFCNEVLFYIIFVSTCSVSLKFFFFFLVKVQAWPWRKSLEVQADIKRPSKQLPSRSSRTLKMSLLILFQTAKQTLDHPIVLFCLYSYWDFFCFLWLGLREPQFYSEFFLVLLSFLVKKQGIWPCNLSGLVFSLMAVEGHRKKKLRSRCFVSLKSGVSTFSLTRMVST